MSNKTKPIGVIVVAVALAAGIAVYWSRQSPASGGSSSSKIATTDALPGGGHVRGKETAPVTLVEFGDYQCPSCGFYYPIVEELLKRNPDKVKLEFHHYPLIQMHPHALAAAMAVEAAGDQGKYWEMHDMIYNHQREWSIMPNPESEFLAYAAQLNLDANKFMQSVKSPDVENRIAEDIRRGTKVNVNGTPTFFINGQQVDPLPKGVDEFTQLIDAAIQSSSQAKK